MYSEAIFDGRWVPILLTLGALIGVTTVAITFLLAQSRIFYAMAIDGLLPPFFARIHHRTLTPWISITICGEHSINYPMLKYFRSVF